MKVAVSVIQESEKLYRARCLSLPGCVVTGESLPAVTREMDCAIRGYLASLKVPPPSEVEQQQDVRFQDPSP